uniref:Uncharacterized protein n=1 Tax=Leersia perrieri TaxID=77586 RepID=A0A0D9VPW0_9ORYZ
MASSSSAMVRVVLVAVLLMQFCNTIMAARLLDGELTGSWLQEGVAGKIIVQVIKAKNGPPPGTPNCPRQAGGGVCPQKAGG